MRIQVYLEFSARAVYSSWEAELLNIGYYHISKHDTEILVTNSYLQSVLVVKITWSAGFFFFFFYQSF